MKKVLNYVFSIVLIGVLLMQNVYAMVNVEGEVSENYWDLGVEEEIWGYPIVPEDSETWEKLNFAERLEACNAPADVLDNMSTESVISLALDYPFLISVLGYNNISDGISRFAESSNVLSELLERDDAAKILYEEFTKRSVNVEMATLNETQQTNLFVSNLRLQLLLGWEPIVNQLSIEEQAEVVTTVFENAKLAQESGAENVYSTIILEMQDGYHSLINSNTDIVRGESTIANVTEGFVNTGSTAMGQNGATYYKGRYYKYDTSAYCLMYIFGDFTSAQKTSLNSEIADLYPEWNYISGATKCYNCHSLAWIGNGSNNHWIDDPTAFCNASTYFTNKGTDVKIGGVGWKVVIYNNQGIAHSVNATSVASGSGKTSWMTTTTCVSKLGSLGLYSTTLYDMYQYYDGLYYKAYDPN